MSNDSNRKYKRPKQKTFATTNPEAPRSLSARDEDRSECPELVCPLLAKDSEWVDILQNQLPNASQPSSSTVGDDEAVLQLEPHTAAVCGRRMPLQYAADAIFYERFGSRAIHFYSMTIVAKPHASAAHGSSVRLLQLALECEDGPQLKPLAIMFPGLLERDPQALEGMLTKAMSTTEVTRHLVDLGEKANFSFMKKSNRLIPPGKQWLESLTENSNSHCSLESYFFTSSVSSDYDADGEITEEQSRISRKQRKKLFARNQEGRFISHDFLRIPQIQNESLVSYASVTASALTVENQREENDSATGKEEIGETNNITNLDINKSE